MKSIRAITLGAGLLVAAGCQDLTEVPKDFVAPENFYQNEGDAIAAVNSVYASFVNLQSPFSSNDYLGREGVMLIEYPAVYVTSRLSAGNERSQMGTFSPQFTTSHNYIDHTWRAAYAGINRANAVIARVPAIDMDETRKAQIVGEATFLRALHYYFLASLFGGVPLKLEETTAETAEQLTARASAAETWAQIAKDLTEAAAALPASWPSSNYGRVTKNAAYALLGKAYLQSAATVPTPGDYQKAIDAFRQVSGASLAADYASLFNGTNERSPEILFSFQHVRVDGAGGRLTEWFSPKCSPEVWPAGGQNQFQAERPFYDSYETGDVRKDGTWMTSWIGLGRTMAWEWTSGIEKNNKYCSTGPVPRKYVDWGSPDAGSDGIDYVIIRYADVLMGLAEGINEVSGPAGEAYGYVNQIRARAGLDPLTTGLSKEDFRNALFVERDREFALEFQGVMNIRRNWEFAKARIEANMKLARSTSGGGIDINKKPFTSSVEKCTVSDKAVCYTPIDDKWKLYPIPAKARLLNPNLAQNSGW